MAAIEIWQGDITTLEVDVIVNAANNRLSGGGGVDGAIHEAAGPELDTACREIGFCATGKAVITRGYNLPANYIIHTVGPVWGAQDEAAGDTLLASCYQTSLKLAAAYQLKTIAFPAISTGVYGYPHERAARIAVEAVRDATANAESVEKIILVCYQPDMCRVYTQVMNDLEHRIQPSSSAGNA